MWNLNGLRPETSLRLRIASAFLVALGVAACGPNSGNLAVYTIVFTLSDTPEDLALLDFQVAYTGGRFVGSGAAVDCDLVAEDDDETADFDDDDNGLLDVEIDATDNPLVDGADIVTCEFESDEQPSANNFTVTILAAEDDAGEDVDPDDVAVVVTSTDISGAAASPALGEVTE